MANSHQQSVESLFNLISPTPPDVVFEINQKFQRDTDPTKINCSIGTYLDDTGSSHIFSVVRSVEESFVKNDLCNDYLPLEGLRELFEPTQILVFSSQSRPYKEGRIATIQSLSGTGAISVGALFLKQMFSISTAYVSDPTWANHTPLLESHGYRVHKYPYWNFERQCLRIDQMLVTLRNAPYHSLVVLQTCAHNPTGVDPTHEEWGAIKEVVQERQLIPFFDNAYQGCCSGDIDKDVFPIRLFDSANIPLLVAQSFAKNMGLYGQRIGMLHITAPSSDHVPHIMSKLKQITRRLYSSPPRYGAYVVNRILRSNALKEQWLCELKSTFVERLSTIRSQLYIKLQENNIPGCWEYLLHQRGLFFLCGLTPQQCNHLARNHHVYILPSGRVSIAGLNSRNIDRFIKAIKETLVKC